MFAINLSKDAAKFLRHVHPKHGAQIARKLRQLQNDSMPGDAEHLKGYAYMRVDAGEYRIVYKVQDDVLYVALIGKRNDDDVYKKLKRK